VPPGTRFQWFSRTDGYGVNVYWMPDGSMAAYVIGGRILYASGWFQTHTSW
jgi:hypothetical protein